MESGALASSLGLLAAVALLLVLLAAALWWVRLRAGGASWWRPASRRLELLEVRALGPRHRLVLVRVDDRQALIGVSPGQISLIDRWVAEPRDLPSADSPAESAAQRS